MMHKIVRIKDLVELINGHPFKQMDWGTEGMKIIRIQNLNSPDASYNFTNKQVNPKYIVEKNDILISWAGSLSTSFGAYQWTGEEALLNQHIFKVKFISEEIDHTYFKHVVNQALIELLNKTRGLGLKHLKKSQIENYEFRLISIENQRKAVKAISLLENLINQRKETIYFLDDYLESIFHYQFGDPILNGKNWDIADIGEINFKNGFAFKSKNFKLKSEKRIPLIKIGSISNNKFDDNKFDFLDENENHEKFIIRNGDLILSLTGTSGKDDYGNICIVKSENYDKYYLNQRVAKVSFDTQSYNSMFIYYLFKHKGVKKYILSTSKALRQANLSTRKLETLNFIKPAKILQDSFSEIIEKSIIHKDNLESSLRLMEELHNGYIYKTFSKQIEENVEEIEKLIEDDIKLEIFLNTINSSDYESEEQYNIAVEDLYKILDRTRERNQWNSQHLKGIIQRISEDKIILETNKENKFRLSNEAI